MKKITIYSSLAVLVAAVSWACSSSFLDEAPRGFLSGETLQSQQGIEASLIGAYAMLDGYNINGVNTWTANPHNWILGSVPSDDAYKGSEQTDFPEITQLEIYQWSAGNALINDKWVQNYEGIVRVNNTLKLLTDTEGLTEEDANRMKGEALFLRGYYHFELYKVWGNIPYVTEADVDFIQPGSPAESVRDSVILDLTEAVELLPESQDDRGRADKTAARALLGKVHMYGENKDYSAAIAQFEPIVASRSLANCLKDVFQTSTENNSEVLFAVQASTNDGSNSANANWLNQLAHPAGPAFGCCGFHQPSQDLVNAYRVDAMGLPLLYSYNVNDLDPDATKVTDAVDPRLDLTVGRDNVPFLDWGVHAPNWIRDRAFSGPYSPKKFIHYKSEPVSTGGWNNNANSGVNYPVIRLADVMLLLAEAYVKTDTKLDQAVDLVNRIRERAGNCAQGPNKTATGDDIRGSAVIVSNLESEAITWATYKVAPYPADHFNGNPAMLLDAIRFERRLELALEGHRFFDLRRWDYDADFDAAAVLNSFTARAAQTRAYYADAATYTGHQGRHEWYPIPTTQINANTRNGEQVLKQNPGW